MEQLYKYDKQQVKFVPEDMAHLKDNNLSKVITRIVLFLASVGVLFAFIWFQNKVILLKDDELAMKDSIISKLSKQPKVIIKTDTGINVTATCYHANKKECDGSPNYTADGSHIDTTSIDELRWLAISRDLENLGFKMGGKVLIKGISKDFDGVWEIHDRMNRRFDRKIDFLISDKNKKGNLFKNVKMKKYD